MDLHNEDCAHVHCMHISKSTVSNFCPVATLFQMPLEVCQNSIRPQEEADTHFTQLQNSPSLCTPTNIDVTFAANYSSSNQHLIGII